MAVPSELPLAMFSKLTRFLPVEGLLDLGCTGKSLYCVATDDAARRAANLEDEEAFLAWYNSPYSLGLGGRKMPLGCMTYSILVPKKVRWPC